MNKSEDREKGSEEEIESEKHISIQPNIIPNDQKIILKQNRNENVVIP